MYIFPVGNIYLFLTFLTSVLGYGVAGPGRLVTSSSMFRIASITKPITAMAVMKAVEDGRIQLEQKVFYPGGQIFSITFKFIYGNVIQLFPSNSQIFKLLILY